MTSKFSHQSNINHGFSVNKFRSFNGKSQFLGPFGKLNVIIGANNSGKSNILRYIRDVYSPFSQGAKGEFASVAEHDNPDSNIVSARDSYIMIPISQFFTERFSTGIQEKRSPNHSRIE